MNFFGRLKATIRKLPTRLYEVLANLNIFLLRDLGSNIDLITAKRLGRWATRLYIVLLIITMIILFLYAVVQPQTVTKTFDKPPLNHYNNLIKNYGNILKCSCSLIASKHDRFIKIEPIFHEVRKNDYLYSYSIIHNYRFVRVHLLQMNGELI